MPLSVTVKKRRGVPRWDVAVTDPKRGVFVAYFEFELKDGLQHVGTRIEVTHPDDPFPAAELRDFPMRRWIRAAHAAVQDRVVALSGTAREASSAEGNLTVTADVTADAVVRPGTVGLSVGIPQASPRTQKADERLRQVAEEYRANVRDGLRDPVSAIARAHGVESATARSWVHRARQKGFLGPAVGPTPGEEI